MKLLVLVPVLCCGLVINETAAADPTCKAKAIKQKLIGEALISFVKKCETDAYLACAEQATGKKLTGPASDRFIDTCATKAMGTGPRWCVPHYCQNNSDCTGGDGCGVCWAAVRKVRGPVQGGQEKQAGACPGR